MTNIYSTQEQEIFCPLNKDYIELPRTRIQNYEYNNLAEMIFEISEKWGLKKAFTMVFPNGFNSTISYSDVNFLSDCVAVYLKEVLHVKSGDRIAIQMPNCLACPVIIFGIFKAGCVIVNTNPLYTPQEMQHQFLDSGSSILFIADMFVYKLEKIINQTKINHVISVSLVEFFHPIKKALVQGNLKYIKKLIPKHTIKHTKFSKLINEGKFLLHKNKINIKNYQQGVSLNDLCALQYTGGTTGVSKGAMLSHKNILSNMYQIVEVGKSKTRCGEETLLTVLPLYHIFAFSLNLISFYYVGAHNILIPNPKPLLNLNPAFQLFPISWISGVNTLFNALLHEKWFTANPPKNLKTSIAGGTALHSAVAQKWKEITKTPLLEGFGLTEASPVVTFNPFEGTIKENSVGIPVSNTEVILLDDNGIPVKCGEIGEIAVRGPQVMKGYWNHPEETKKVFQNEWLLTGDIGILDSDGYLKIVDRKKDLVLVSGFNVYPSEVEDCIAQLPGVKEVAVIGVSDPHSGEAVKTFIVKNKQDLTQKEIIEHCKKYLTSYKIPKYIEFKDDLPKTPIGKILRKELKILHCLQQKV